MLFRKNPLGDFFCNTLRAEKPRPAVYCAYKHRIHAGGETDTGESGSPLLKIGELAKLVNLRNSTIRHWTKEGLLEVAEVTDAGYQLYAQETVERIGLINELKSRRFTLGEIREKISRDSAD